jgi:hypothetical protein
LISLQPSQSVNQLLAQQQLLLQGPQKETNIIISK